MSSKNCGAETAKRRKLQEGRDERSEDGTASHDSRKRTEGSEETDDLLRPWGDSNEKEKPMAAKDWVKACKSLMKRMEKGRSDIQEVATEEYCERCGNLAAYSAELATDMLKESQYSLREYARRYLQALRDLDSERGEREEELATKSEEWEKRWRRMAEEKKEAAREREEREEEMARKSEEWEERLRRLAEEKRETERESDQLRAALAAREHRAGGGRNEGGHSSLPLEWCHGAGHSWGT